MKESLQKFYHVDSLMNIVMFGYLFIRLGISVAIYGNWLYVYSLISILSGIICIFLLDWLFFKKKKLFTIQLLITFLLLFLYGFIFILFTSILFGLFSIGFFLFLMLLTSKSLRFVLVISSFSKCKKERMSTRLKKANLMKRKLKVGFLTASFCFPLIIFLFGLSPVSLAGVDIDINHVNGKDQGSPAIQLSFYATLSSHDYLTNETILKALNGTDFGGGKLNPTEILLLIRESELKNTVSARKLAFMVKNCTKSGLFVWTWFVYEEINGFYPSLEDYAYLPVFKQLFDAWVANYSLNIYGILFDNEEDRIISSTPLNDTLNFLSMILNHRRSAKLNWSEAITTYRTVVAQWKAQGYKIALIGTEFALYDILDGDPDLQQALGTLNNPPDVWERVSFMLYRGCEYHTVPAGRDYLYSLARLHKTLYNQRSVVALGCMAYMAYNTIDDILKDIAILKFLNYSTVELFEFRAFYAAFGYDGLISILNSSLNGWKYPVFRVNLGTTEFLIKSATFFGDLFLDFY